MFSYIGRQAIYNSDFVIAGYELLYRNGTAGNTAFILDGDSATRSVLSDAVNVFGIPQLTEGLPAYINFTRNLLMDNFAYLADPKQVVLEIPGDIFVDDALVEKLSQMKAAGYRLSLDNYSQTNGILRFDRISHMFDVIRLNVRKNNRLHLQDLISKLRRSRARLLADQVETEEQFDLARSLHFSLFQGYYFEKPVVLSKQVPLAATAYGKLINELLKFNVNFEACCAIIDGDALLTHLFMQQVPNVRFQRGKNADKIKAGLMTIGTEGLRRWISVILLKQSNVTKSDDLLRQAYARGRFIERLMENSDTSAQPGQGFFLGLFSLLDRIMGIQQTDMLNNLKMGPALQAALMGREENEYSLFLQYAVIYEMANARLILPDIHVNLSDRAVSALYLECTSEADMTFSDLVTSAAPMYQGNLLR